MRFKYIKKIGRYFLGVKALTFLVLITLKLTGTIDWSWWIITAPLWTTVSFFILIAIFLFLIIILLREITRL